jgi:hypothetical protein
LPHHWPGSERREVVEGAVQRGEQLRLDGVFEDEKAAQIEKKVVERRRGSGLHQAGFLQ